MDTIYDRKCASLNAYAGMAAALGPKSSNTHFLANILPARNHITFFF